jgi:Domain of unknown function (DUF4158)
MPGEFLTDAQEQAYGHFVGPPSNQQLSRYFHLDDADRERVNVRRGAHNKLGFALQLTSVRFLGTFLAEPTAVPSNVVAYVAAQLSIRDVACLADYAARPSTGWEHAAEIRHVQFASGPRYGAALSEADAHLLAQDVCRRLKIDRGLDGGTPHPRRRGSVGRAFSGTRLATCLALETRGR